MNRVSVDPDFFAIELAHLEPATVLEFDLYLGHAGPRPLHYRHKDMEFTAEIRARLSMNGVRELLVPAVQVHAFERYRARCRAEATRRPERPARPPARLSPEETRLPGLLADPERPIDQRCMALLGVSRRVIEAAMSDLGSPGLSERVHHVAEATGRFLIEEPAAFGTLVQLMRLDYDSLSHSQHTALYTTQLALACGISDLGELSCLGRAALLHDVGKADLPASITERDCPPGDPDFPRWCEHAMRGTAMLREAGWEDRTCLEVAAHHHENADGSGFPAGLAGAKIPVAVRLVRIADGFDSLTTAFRNRPALTGFQALWKMRREFAPCFDQRIVGVFIETLVPPAGCRRP